ncbi:TPA: helix-turn-helix transcriptional regulator [Streptococcus pyogenes]|nr:helix-turn-helix transcriptional regulator [Streptococcus pyogenes]HEQ9398874.1 helix-turn-helix transcriptional regulator [Streptococcus pyogenes]
MSTIKNRLKALRTQREITQDELVSELNSKLNDGEKTVSKMTVSNWENNKHAIKPYKAQKLADYFNVPVPYLLGYMSEETLNSFKVVSEVSKPTRETIANINQQMEELSTFALENDLSETIKENCGSEEIFKIYNDLKELSFMVKYKAQKIGLSEKERKEIEYFNHEMLAFIDALMEFRIELNNAVHKSPDTQ